MASRRLYIHATNIHQGGGRTLLDALAFAEFREADVVIVADARMRFGAVLPSNVMLRTVKATVGERLAAEHWIQRQAEAGDVVLCFGNLPPLFKLRAYAAVFVQNRYLVDDLSLDGFRLGTKLRLACERLWFCGARDHADLFVVQTPSMARCLEKRGIGGEGRVMIAPFAKVGTACARTSRQAEPKLASTQGEDFIYVASGEPHKNHCRLIEAWVSLAEEGIHPRLLLTLSPQAFPKLCAWIEAQTTAHGLQVENLGVLSPEKLRETYRRVAAAIYPSLFESFGLPLIEARQAGLAVLAGELDYVRDVVDPEQSFDPHSPRSIARAVKRFLGQSAGTISIDDAGQFLARLWERAASRCVS